MPTKKQLEEQIIALKLENQDYEKHIVEQERELQDLRTKNTKIHVLEACNHQQKLRIKELEEEMFDKIKELEEENDELKGDKAELKEENDEINRKWAEDNERFGDVIACAEEQIEKLKEEECDYESMRKHRDTLLEESEERFMEIEKLKEENEKLKLENQDLRRRVRVLCENYDNIIDELKEENEKLKEELKAGICIGEYLAGEFKKNPH